MHSSKHILGCKPSRPKRLRSVSHHASFPRMTLLPYLLKRWWVILISLCFKYLFSFEIKHNTALTAFYNFLHPKITIVIVKSIQTVLVYYSNTIHNAQVMHLPYKGLLTISLTKLSALNQWKLSHLWPKWSRSTSKEGHDLIFCLCCENVLFSRPWI